LRPIRSAEYLASLLRELRKLPSETEWVEFKHNKADPEEIGEYISALANAAALAGKAHAYLVWGVDDVEHAVVGTTFAPGIVKVGNEEFESWLLKLLSPKIQFHFFSIEVDGKAVVLLEIERAHREPVQFQGSEWIRVGSYKKRLSAGAASTRSCSRPSSSSYRHRSSRCRTTPRASSCSRTDR